MSKERETRVSKTNYQPSGHLSTTVTICGNLGGPSSKAKYNKGPIVNKYREGKVKRSAERTVK